jgi:hypothetical protein
MSVIAIPLPYVITIKYKISKIPDQNMRFYLYLASFSLLLFIFLIRFFLSPLSLSCSSSSSPGSLSLLFLSLALHLPHKVLSLSLSPLSLLGRQGHLPLVGCEDTLCLIFLSIAVEVLSLSFFFLSICLAGVFKLYSTDFFFFSLGFQSV